MEPRRAKRKQSQIIIIWKRLRRNKMAVAGLVVVCVLLAGVIFANFLTPYAYDKQNLAMAFQMPSLQHLFGTDNLGRDIFTRVLYGG